MISNSNGTDIVTNNNIVGGHLALIRYIVLIKCDLLSHSNNRVVLSVLEG